jgi:hypothetical protein
MSKNMSKEMPLSIHFCDLNDYILRQKTQEYLFESKKMSNKINIFLEESKFHFNENYEIEKKNFKTELKNFKKTILTYMEDNNRLEDKFLKYLADDIYIIIKTLGTKSSLMYTYARQSSQGRQYSYNCSQIKEDLIDYDLCVPKIKRSQNNPYTLNEDDVYVFEDDDLNNEDEDEDNVLYSLSQELTSPYVSNGVVLAMRQVTCDLSLPLPLIGNNLKTKIKDPSKQD